MAASGLVIVIASVIVLTLSRRAEVSVRSLAMALVGAGGALLFADAFPGDQVPNWLHAVTLPPGVALWCLYALLQHRGCKAQCVQDLHALIGSEKDKRDA
jgi:hypothetical protein